MKNAITLSFAVILGATFYGCKKKGCTDPIAINYTEKAKKDDGSCEFGPNLILKFKFDPNQERLDNFGQPATVPSGNAAQSPTFYGISAHYVELAPTANTQLGGGQIVYQGKETTAGGDDAVDFEQAKICKEGEVFVEVPLTTIEAGTYEWMRVSLTYQNYDIAYKANGFDLTGRLASFVGFNTYIKSYTLDEETVNINANKLQGYWGFETVGQVSQGEAPGTTVPNPISSSSPIPAGSCVVTGDFDNPLIITGNETEDIEVTISLSTNNSFEWKDDNSNGKYDPVDGEQVVDMGLRGLEPIVK